jgi:hypothetical protein
VPLTFCKIDIERWEFETLAALIKPYLASGRPLPFGQLQLEVHIWNMSFEEYLTWWEMLEAAGLRPFWTEVCFFFLFADLSDKADSSKKPNLVYQNYNGEGSTDLAEVRRHGYNFRDHLLISPPAVLVP